MARVGAEIHPTALIGENVTVGQGSWIGPHTILYDNVTLGDETIVMAHAIVGEPLGGGRPLSGNPNPETRIGPKSLIRSGSVIYCGVTTGIGFETGHFVQVREYCELGDYVRIHHAAHLRPHCSVGQYSRIQGFVETAAGTQIGQFVWVFPHCVLTDDPYPPSHASYPVTIGNYSVIGPATHLMPGVTIGSDVLIGGHSRVICDVPDGAFAIGNPAQVVKPAAELRNKFNPEQGTYPWRLYFDQGMPWEGMGYTTWLERHPAAQAQTGD